MSSDSAPETPPITFGEIFSRFRGWVAAQPLAAVLLAGCLGTLIYFYGFYEVFGRHVISVAQWSWEAWNPENNQEHAPVILPVAIFLIWYHRKELQQAKKQPSALGLAFVIAGVLAFVIGAWMLQPRLCIIALPLLIYGAVRYCWGAEVGRVFIFPCLFLLFMVPIGGVLQGTVTLQLLVSQAVKILSAIVGVEIQTEGTAIRALDGSFDFEIAEGCSGIRSLMAMTTLAALYVHFTQREIWKQLVIFAGSILFALIGNVGRVFTIILVARFISPKLAANAYHDHSAFIFFPIAVASMVAFSRLLNYERKPAPKDLELPPPGSPSPTSNSPETKRPVSTVSYDY